jgi:2-oxo-3-hexenedioate decarboxylase
MEIDIRKMARLLDNAEMGKRAMKRITADCPELTVDDAYRIQDELVAIKRARGHRVVARKMGLTSQAKMKQMNVEEPIHGRLFDYMLMDDQGVLAFEELIHPRVEAEIAFILGEDLEGPEVTAVQVLEATEYVLPALEVLDSRYENFRFTLADVIADNTSASRFVLGSKFTSPAGLDLDLIGVTLHINGEVRGMGAGAAVLGHPANSVAMLVHMLARKGEKLRAGEVVLTGGITEAIAVKPGDVITARMDQLGDVNLVVK